MTRALWPYLLAAWVASIALAGWQGYAKGIDVAEARAAKATAQLNEKLDAAHEAEDIAEAKRLATQTERDTLAMELENAARNDPDPTPACLSPDRVRRLKLR